MKNVGKQIKATALAGLAGVLGYSLASAAEYAYDAELEDIETEINVGQMPIFPQNLIQSGYTEGEVHVIVEIDHHGELRDYMVVYASHRDFARSIEYVIKTWDFTPPKWKGEPISIVRGVEVNFAAKGALIEFNLSSGLFENVFNQGKNILA